MTVFNFRLDGPALPQGRARCACRGRIPRVYDPPRSAAFKATVAAAMQIAARKQKWKAPPKEAALWVEIECHYTGAPIADVDNLAKGLLDAAQKAGIIKNDNAVVELRIVKHTRQKANYFTFDMGVYDE